MSSERHFDRATDMLRSFRHLGAPVEDLDGAARTRQQAIQAIERKIRAASEHRSRLPTRVLLIAAAAAATIALALLQFYRSGAWQTDPVATASRLRTDSIHVSSVNGSVTLLRQGQADRTGVPRELMAGDELSSASDASAALKLARGTRVELGAGTRVRVTRVDAQEQRLTLELGRLSLVVPKLEAGHALVVQTRDAEVSVVGTRFSVDVAEGAIRTTTITRVHVAEGIVRVRTGESERSLRAGESWSSASESSRTARATPPGGLERSLPSRADSSTRSKPTSPVSDSAEAPRQEARSGQRESSDRSAATESQELAQENRLLGLALSARQRGDDALAVRHLDELLARRSNSPLAESARIERLRALRRLGRKTDAVREARRYLAEYGQGFARDEAREVVLQPERTSKPAPPGKR